MPTHIILPEKVITAVDPALFGVTTLLKWCLTVGAFQALLMVALLEHLVQVTITDRFLTDGAMF